MSCSVSLEKFLAINFAFTIGTEEAIVDLAVGNVERYYSGGSVNVDVQKDTRI